MIKSPIKYYSSVSQCCDQNIVKKFDTYKEAVEHQEKVQKTSKCLNGEGIYIGRHVDYRDKDVGPTQFELDQGLIVQPEVGGCGVACIAMAMKVSYDEARKIIKKAISDKNPKWKVQDGLSVIEIRASLLTKYKSTTRLLENFSHYFYNRESIITVPSLNYPGLLHFLFVRNGEVFDPSPGPLRYPGDATSINGDNVFPVDMVIWR